MEGIESVALFEEKVAITPRDMANQNLNIHGILVAKLGEKMEAKCSLHGWVLPDSIKILSRSMGYLENGRFTGDLVFHVQAQAKVLNPPSGSHIVCEVVGNNMMGIYGSYKVRYREMDRKTKKAVTTSIDAIKVILPRDLHIGDEEFSKVKIGDYVRVEIKKSRFQVNDKFILSVGIFEGKEGSGYVPPAVEEIAEVVVEEKGPSEAAGVRLGRFERAETEEERQKRLEAGIVLDSNLPALGVVVEEGPGAGAAAASGAVPPLEVGEPIYFNAAKMKPYREFDNRFPSLLTLNGKQWPSVEHYFQAMKFPTLPEYQEQIRAAATASAAIKLGTASDKPVRADWNQVREEIMREAVDAKFEQNPPLKQLLLDTHPRPLIYADPKDSFWGFGQTQMGQNKLGTILMKYRSASIGRAQLEALDG